MDKFSVDVCRAISSDPDILSGTPCFAGTRVPVRILFEYVESNEPLSVFHDDFPSVNRGQVIRVLEQCRNFLLTTSDLAGEPLAPTVSADLPSEGTLN